MYPNLSAFSWSCLVTSTQQLQELLGGRAFSELDEEVIRVLTIESVYSFRCMVGYVNASLSVFRISDFENRSEPESDGSEFSGTPLKYCR